jgi:DNA-binding transcriptional ArsR family regulator
VSRRDGALVQGIKRCQCRFHPVLFRAASRNPVRRPLLGPVPKHTLTRICSIEYIQGMESVFEVIAEPNRRAILSLLVSSQQSVGEIERQLHMPQPTVSKHLRVLRDAGFVESTVDAQRRLYRLKPEPLQEVDMWLAQFRRFWSAHVDALERHLDRMDRDQSTPTKMKTRRRRRGPKREREKGARK